MTLNGDITPGESPARNVVAADVPPGDVPLAVVSVVGQRFAPVGRALRGTDILAFNQALSQIASAGLPLEEGLRLAAADAGSSRVRGALRRLVEDLERGLPLADALDAQRGSFPPAYSRVLSAAVLTGNLPAMLFSLGRHQITLHRLHRDISRALFYPLVVLFGLALIATLIGTFVLPQMTGLLSLYSDQRVQLPRFRWGAPPPPPPSLPWSTQWVLLLAPYLPLIGLFVIVACLLVPTVMMGARLLRIDGRLTDAVAVRLPIFGPVLRHSALARFTDVLAISVRAGMDLPAALRLAGDTVGYPRLRADAEAVAISVENGNSSQPTLRLLPAATMVALTRTQPGASLADTLSLLALLHQQQAEARASRVPILVLPIALLIVAALIAVLMASIVAPMSSILRLLMG